MRLFPGVVSTLVVAGLVLAAVSAQADKGVVGENLELRQTLEKRMDAIRADREAYEQIMNDGRDRTILCKTCHGEDGMAVKEGTPNLAGQNPVYIVDQFQRFGDGRRYDFFMAQLAKSFDDEEKIKIALYYASMPNAASGGGKVELMGQGKALFERSCTECHGSDGKGQEGYARLAGQRPEYVTKMLKEFKERTGRRNNPWMSGVALKLSDTDMEALAAYIASLK
ncbi:MAG: hypothetical protein B0D96_07720 [Candidatus Sedimenticola endophacoides]|uniref:Cytochrome C n=1 Tax=Candidatus Sedimenticola endophacoides TaxID=2548426 RepID=A0A657PJT9_9GAMM|nr:MAG: hypothetical protein B0D94_12435 [Candidatus Sedimenticola endophacoides]OQX33170.1 MAG: hypothetical protein B0D84_04990 [Candidatus Sedimenticola endophacoides]OQX35057.1 MAG: hypothetical protein B0D96_07720 [Candidatus Sedimenticola endophacoides]OQX40398.1 MAG: hypothetical protein B0D89_07890 [Candidatus Sedimenticola endophacoides]OQX40933.1 MAG: hypothetical protein B0D88_08190 [Candidatus Sedimenticola endophacoides]